MLSTDTIFIASNLEALISGDITSKDIVKSKAIPQKVEEIIKKIVFGGDTKSVMKKYNFRTISDALNTEESIEEELEKSANLVKNTDIEFTDLIPKIQEVKEILKGLLPFNEQNSITGIILSEPSKREELAYLRLFAAIDNPLKVLGRIGENSFTKLEMDIVKQVYPELISGIEGMILTYLTELKSKGKEVIGHTRVLGIKRFFGEDISSISPIARDEDLEQSKKQSSKIRNFEAGSRMMPEGDRELL